MQGRMDVGAGTWAAGEGKALTWGELPVTGQGNPHACGRAGVLGGCFGGLPPTLDLCHLCPLVCPPRVGGRVGFLGLLVDVSVGAGTDRVSLRIWILSMCQ